MDLTANSFKAHGFSDTPRQVQFGLSPISPTNLLRKCVTLKDYPRAKAYTETATILAGTRLAGHNEIAGLGPYKSCSGSDLQVVTVAANE